MLEGWIQQGLLTSVIPHGAPVRYCCCLVSCPGRGTGGTGVTRSSLTIWSLSSSFFFSGSWLVMCHFTGVLLLSCCHIPQTHGHLFSFFFGGRGRSMIVTRSFSSLPEVVAWGQRVISWHSYQTLHLTTLFFVYCNVIYHFSNLVFIQDVSWMADLPIPF